MKSLLVMVPTRNRRDQAERLLKSFETSEPADETVLMFITDEDDDSYESTDWGSAVHAVLSPRAPLTEIFNRVALEHADDFDAIMTVGDDHLFTTAGWDGLLMSALEDLGGTGWVYPDDKRRSGFPEIWAASSDLVKFLGWFALPVVKHFYCDNAISELGKRTDLLRYVPGAVIEHLHYSVTSGAIRDSTYAEAEDSSGNSDLAAYREWREKHLANTVSRIRREFNPDVAWILSNIS